MLEEPGKEPEEHDLGDNLVVNGGVNLLCVLLAGTLSDRIQFGIIGTGTATPTKTDSGLGTAVASVTATFTLIASGVTVTAIFPAGTFTSTQAITEFGCFTSTIMYNRITFSAINVSPITKATFKLDLTFD